MPAGAHPLSSKLGNFARVHTLTSPHLPKNGSTPGSIAALFTRMFVHSPDALLLTRRDGPILAANPAACRLLGYSEAELVALDRADLVDIHDGRVLAAHAKRDHDGATSGVMAFTRKDTSTFAAEISSCLFQDEQGMVCATIQLRDISGKVTGEQHLRKSEERLRFALDAAEIGDWDMDLRTNVARRSLWHDRIFGYAEPVAVWGYDTFLAHVHSDDRARVDAAFQAALSGVGAYDVEFRAVWPDSSVHWLWSKGRFYFDARGKAWRVAAILVDVTKRRLADEAIKSLNAELECRVYERTAELELAIRELETFSYSVSHDLRGPLNVIAGFSQLLAADRNVVMPGASRTYLAHIGTASQRMQGLIEDILRLARIGRTELKRESTDLSAMAREIVRALRNQDPARAVEVRIADGLRAHTDAALIRIVLENLLGNAWKFSSDRSDARIEFGAVDDGTFMVGDNGVGFAMKDAERIFRGFQRLHADKEFAGNGIGLSIVQRVIKRHGGRVWAEASPGAGARIFFHLAPGN